MTPTAIFDRDQRRWERKVARIRAEHEREQAHRARTQQLVQAIASMASRRALSERQYGRAYMTAGGVWADKTAEHYERASTRQSEAYWRLLNALANHANKNGG